MDLTRRVGGAACGLLSWCPPTVSSMPSATSAGPVAAHVTAAQALAWRLRRQLLDPLGTEGPVEVARRLCGLQAQVASAAELAVLVRQCTPDPGAVGRELAARRLVKTWAMRGTLHLLPADEVGAWLAPLAALRSWHKPSWQKASGITPVEMDRLGAAVTDALGDDVLTREQLVAAVLGGRGSKRLEEQLRSGWSSVLKPLAWQGLLCQGPPRGNRITFARPEAWVPGWQGVPAVEEATVVIVPAYLRAYGPATPEAFDRYLTRGTSPKAALRQRFAGLGDRLARVDVDGSPAYVLSEDVDELATTRPGRAVRLVGAFDQAVLGPSTSDVLVLAPEHRPAVSKAAGWISPVVLRGGRVVGVWDGGADGIEVSLFDDEGPVPAAALRAELARVASLTRGGGVSADKG